ncbi:hypothetical protein RGQ29_030677 [Quercus rubra]|uniref:Terpene synthase metal-binding domain-containing protein n=1 Tax=Quercus rubra TaxID=3512 RepID=A0AAN7EJX2_QUERU|nr:hypothetical protein RGQ29_030677 [Quercus rubra]
MKRIFDGLYNNDHCGDTWKAENLYARALKFRLPRQHRYVSLKTEVLPYVEPVIYVNTPSIAYCRPSFLSIEGENILEEAKDFSTKHLEEYINQNKDKNLAAIINHSLELPLHWRMLRLEARWFIDIYRTRKDMYPILLELAELDFNMVQAAHQFDLKQVSRWWKSIALAEKLSFARDRLMENFFWTTGKIFLPQFGYCRRILTKVNSLITTIDDTFVIMKKTTHASDIYIIPLTILNEMAFDTLKEQRFHINIRYLKKAWADLCRSYLLEAKCPQEYIENAWISRSAPTILVHAYFFVTNPITMEALDCLEGYPNIIRWSSMILRLVDDFGTSMGDVPKAIQCYMNETSASEEDACEYVRYLIFATWNKLNEEQVVSYPFNQLFIEIALNLARMAQCIYQHGDGHGIENHETKDRLFSLLIQSIPLNKDRRY